MNTKNTITVGVALLAMLKAVAADPGGTPGLVKAVFKGSAFDTTSDVMANALGYTIVPEEMYATSCPEKTTYAWSGYMFMTGGVKYNFKGCYDDFVSVKIGTTGVLTKGGECKERTGSYTPTATDWYKIEFRVANNGGGGGCQNSTQYGILWSVEGDTTWRRVMDYGDGSLFRTGVTGLEKLEPKSVMPLVLSSKMRKSDKTIMDITYIVLSPKATVNVRALAFQDGERSFWKVVRPTTFVDDEDGNPTAGNIGDGVPANVRLNLSWKVPSNWDIDIAKVKFEILTPEAFLVPIETITIPATSKKPQITLAVNAPTDNVIFDALLWMYACDDPRVDNVGGDLYVKWKEDGPADRWVSRDAVVGDRWDIHEWFYGLYGYEPLMCGNLLDYARKSTRKELWWNSKTRNCAIKTSTKPARLYIGEKAYCVIDVSGGPSAASYPVSYLDTEPVNGWSDEYKTTKILLRRCEPGKFMMQNNKDVTLTKPYYMGVFTVTQKQYEQVMGTNPTQSDHQGAMRPVEISWNDIRGDSATYNWPTVKTVDPATFVGKIQSKTGLNFDLPTEAQWECACRAGTSSEYNNGGYSERDASLVGHISSVVIVDIGLYLPNFWGLYDMNGNVGQWCLDHFGDINGDPAIDYVGAESGWARVIRGSSIRYDYFYGTSFVRFKCNPSITRDYDGFFSHLGFRLSRTITEE